MEKIKCPLCETGEIRETENFFTCSNYRYGKKGGCMFNVRKEINVKNTQRVQITQNTLKTILKTGSVTKIAAYTVTFKLDFKYKKKTPKYKIIEKAIED